ncbi:MAG TPA: hypothetical protein VKZ53_11855 [Candidatus Angelobacter sp.]|nr:hypothetical protein [Candidatus Angelobacter sp.]
MKRLLLVVLLMLGMCVMAFPEKALESGSPGTPITMDRQRFLDLNKKAAELRKQKNWTSLREVLTEMRRVMPGATPRYFLRMASVEMHLGHKAEARKFLQAYVSMGLTYDVASDDDLKDLEGDAGFKSIAAAMARNRAKISKAELVCELPQADIMPEDITFNSTSNSFFVSSVRHHSLYEVQLPKAGDKQCGLRELLHDEDARRWPILAVSYDAKRRVLWLTPSALSDFAGVPKEDQGKAALAAVDPNNGKVLRRLELSSKYPAVLGDMSVAPDGTVYVTDSAGGGVYRFRGDLKTAPLEKIADGFFSPQTPVVARDGKRLFVADYSLGVAVIDLSNPAANADKLMYLPHPDNVAVTGLDGLLLDGNSLIGIQNGTEPERIMRFRLNASQTEILSGEVVEQSSEHLGEPTHAVKRDDWIYVTANVGWGNIDDHGELKPGKQFTPPVLLRFKALD